MWRTIWKNDCSFEGDFRQILPVIPSGTKEHIIDATITNSYRWPYFEILTLTENMRLKHNILTEEKYEITEFSNWILDSDNGISNWNQRYRKWRRYIDKNTWKILTHYYSNQIEKITHSIYDDFIHNFNNIEYLRQRAIVSPKIKIADETNQYILSLVPTESITYYSYC